MKVILHADDLGISSGVNEAIFTLMEERKLTSASLLANGPAFDEAVRHVSDYPACSFGVHLNLTEFAPLTSGLGDAPLLGKDRRFWSTYLPQERLLGAVLNEWTAQVKRVRDAGVTISHIDSHHHMHTRFSLLGCLTRLCREQKIHRVRTRQTYTTGAMGTRWRLDHMFYNRRLRARFSCVDEFGAFSALPLHRLDTRSTVEVMVHPGNPRYECETLALRQTIDEEFRLRHNCIPYHALP